MENSKINVEITKNIYDKIQLKIKNPQIGFESVSEYIQYVLEQVLEEEEGTDNISEEETKKIQEELKKMGYI
jgi:Arc/MetJ-type ribon-helix-helix transcriptional regulator